MWKFCLINYFYNIIFKPNRSERFIINFHYFFKTLPPTCLSFSIVFFVLDLGSVIIAVSKQSLAGSLSTEKYLNVLIGIMDTKKKVSDALKVAILL